MRKKILTKKEHFIKNMTKNVIKNIFKIAIILFFIKILISIFKNIFICIKNYIIMGINYMDSLSFELFLVNIFLICCFIMLLFFIPVLFSLFSLKRLKKKKNRV